MMCPTMKASILKITLFVVFAGAVSTSYYIYRSSKAWQLLSEQAAEAHFDSNSSKIKSMKILSGIALRYDNNEWTSADDICQTGVVFPSAVLTSTLQNFSVYFHDEEELQTTFGYMTKNGSWGKRNLHTLMEPLHKVKDAFFIDIYAGLGVFTLPIVKLGLRVIAVEYRYSFTERLCRGIIAGHFKHKAFIVNNLVSHRPRTINLQPKHISQRSGIDLDKSEDSLTRVSSIQLDSLLDRYPIKEAVLKIDMTTEDIQTILNSVQFFDKVKIQYVLMEWVNIARSKDTPKLIAFMDKYELLPCLNAKCKIILQSDQYSAWPAYVLWVNKLLRQVLPAMIYNSTSSSESIRVGDV